MNDSVDPCQELQDELNRLQAETCRRASNIAYPSLYAGSSDFPNPLEVTLAIGMRLPVREPQGLETSPGFGKTFSSFKCILLKMIGQYSLNIFPANFQARSLP